MKLFVKLGIAHEANVSGFNGLNGTVYSERPLF